MIKLTVKALADKQPLSQNKKLVTVQINFLRFMKNVHFLPLCCLSCTSQVQICYLVMVILLLDIPWPPKSGLK